MHIVALGWIYVVLMAAVAEALSAQGTLLGALFTFVLYGVLPLAVVLYLMGTPARKRALRRAEKAAAAPASPARDPAASAAGSDPDGSGHAAAGAPVAPKREEA